MIIDKDEFCLFVEESFAESKSMFEALIEGCQFFNIDYSLVAPVINRSIKEKLEFEASNMNMLDSSTNSLF